MGRERRKEEGGTEEGEERKMEGEKGEEREEGEERKMEGEKREGEERKMEERKEK